MSTPGFTCINLDRYYWFWHRHAFRLNEKSFTDKYLNKHWILPIRLWRRQQLNITNITLNAIPMEMIKMVSFIIWSGMSGGSIVVELVEDVLRRRATEKQKFFCQCMCLSYAGWRMKAQEHQYHLSSSNHNLSFQRYQVSGNNLQQFLCWVALGHIYHSGDKSISNTNGVVKMFDTGKSLTPLQRRIRNSTRRIAVSVTANLIEWGVLSRILTLWSTHLEESVWFSPYFRWNLRYLCKNQ